MGLSMEQLKVLAIIPHVTGAMSVLGSGWIIAEVLRDRTKWQKTYHRLIFVMSFFDCLTSGAFGFSTLPIPKGTPNVYNAQGTTATCTLQGFFVQLSIIGPMYNCMLALYFYLLVARGLPERFIASKIEPYMHAACLIFAFTMGFILLGMNMFNSSTLWCWQNDYPSNCEGKYGEPGPVPCQRGKHAWLFRWVFYYALLWLILAVTGLLMFLLWYRVSEQTKTVAKYDHMINSGTLTAAETTRLRKRSKSNARSRKVASQAFFFMGAFFLTFCAGSINRFTQLVSGKSVYPFLVLHCVFAPAQGFFNFLVYMRPKFIQWLDDKRRRRRSSQNQQDSTSDGTATSRMSMSIFTRSFKRFSRRFTLNSKHGLAASDLETSSNVNFSSNLNLSSNLKESSNRRISFSCVDLVHELESQSGVDSQNDGIAEYEDMLNDDDDDDEPNLESSLNKKLSSSNLVLESRSEVNLQKDGDAEYENMLNNKDSEENCCIKKEVDAQPQHHSSSGDHLVANSGVDLQNDSDAVPAPLRRMHSQALERWQSQQNVSGPSPNQDGQGCVDLQRAASESMLTKEKKMPLRSKSLTPSPEEENCCIEKDADTQPHNHSSLDDHLVANSGVDLQNDGDAVPAPLQRMHSQALERWQSQQNVSEPSPNQEGQGCVDLQRVANDSKLTMEKKTLPRSNSPTPGPEEENCCIEKDVEA